MIGTGLAGLVVPILVTFGARALFTTTPVPAGMGARFLRRLREHVQLDLFAPSIGAGWIAIGLLSLALVGVGIAWRTRRSSLPPL